MNPTEGNHSLVIETHNLGKAFKNVQAVKSLNLQVPEHSIFGFLGPNGAGKTTTIKLLLGLARPTSGSATVFGYDVQRDSLKIRHHVGYLAQNPIYYESMTAREIMRFTLGFFFKGPRKKVEARIAETLDLVGLSDKADRPIKGFSGGERQRLGIAQAQANYPDLLILDEPAASLDPMGRHDVLEVMERLRKHCTIFYSTHILEDVQRVSDTVCILDHGELVAQAPIQQLLGNGGKQFRLETIGNAQGIRPLIAKQPWVTSVEAQPVDGRTEWQIQVTDSVVAEEQLVALAVSEPGVRVTAFGQIKVGLEDVFMNLVGGDHNGRE